MPLSSGRGRSGFSSGASRQEQPPSGPASRSNGQTCPHNLTVPFSWPLLSRLALLLAIFLTACTAHASPPPPVNPVSSATLNSAALDATAGAIERATRQAQATLDFEATATQAASQTRQAYQLTRSAIKTAAIRPAQATLSALPEAGLAFAEVFGDNQAGWREGHFSDEKMTGDLSIADGQYTWQIDPRDDVLLTSWPAAGKSYADFQALAEASGDPQSGAFTLGIVFRQQDERNFYYFGVSNSGNPRFNVVRDGQNDETLFDEIPAYNSTEPVILRVYTLGSYFIFLVNGQIVGATSDARYPSGRLGLGVEAFQQGSSVAVYFRSFEVRAPETSGMPRTNSTP